MKRLPCEFARAGNAGIRACRFEQRPLTGWRAKMPELIFCRLAVKRLSRQPCNLSVDMTEHIVNIDGNGADSRALIHLVSSVYPQAIHRVEHKGSRQ